MIPFPSDSRQIKQIYSSALKNFCVCQERGSGGSRPHSAVSGAALWRLKWNENDWFLRALGELMEMQELCMFPTHLGNHVYVLGVTATTELVAKEMNPLNMNLNAH
ncbi:unnamed protein product [Pleuronectes platessa]|uniref:Uncharacterized protein n=1 Tax=Pleuronectes platessa TaxID=8262 RepID=A0A9N7Z274_PLEPL|nr:unnamed protein product [Pleuronectes platessa]